VKRLLRVDNEEVSVKWEVITEEELNANKGGEAGKDKPDVKPSVSGGFTNDPKDLGLDLFDSNGEGRDVDIDSEENSRLSAGDDSIGVKCAVVVGGMDMVSQAIILAKKLHIIVATPGRLVDHLENTKGFNYKES
jgi:hypothetical protein